VTFHSLRRTFATWLEDPAIGNAGFAALARLLDHSRRSKVTLRYPKATDAALREAVNRLPNLLGPEEPAKTAKAGS
jgi:integrase